MDVIRHKHVLLGITESLTSMRAKGTASETTPHPSPSSTPNSTSVEDTRSVLQFSAAAQAHPEKAEAKATSWPHFSEVFMLSALTKDGIDSLKVRPPCLYIGGYKSVWGGVLDDVVKECFPLQSSIW